jgi:hypothetical protein
MKITLILLCFLIPTAFAADDGDPNVYVHTLGDFDGESLKRDGVVVTKGIPSVSHTAHLPDSSQMKALLLKAGLGHITNWDQFELDVLSVRLKTTPFEKVVKRYPDLDKKSLRKFKDLLIEADQ